MSFKAQSGNLIIMFCHSCLLTWMYERSLNPLRKAFSDHINAAHFDNCLVIDANSFNIYHLCNFILHSNSNVLFYSLIDVLTVIFIVSHSVPMNFTHVNGHSFLFDSSSRRAFFRQIPKLFVICLANDSNGGMTQKQSSTYLLNEIICFLSVVKFNHFIL